jgi:hypothetical protein
MTEVWSNDLRLLALARLQDRAGSAREPEQGTAIRRAVGARLDAYPAVLPGV